jgi:UDP-glucose:glycoprotein glucosyltransferase
VTHTVLAVVDPLSIDAQVLAPLLIYLNDITAVKITVLFNPKLKVSENPLKRFYSTVLPAVTFGADGAMLPGMWPRTTPV